MWRKICKLAGAVQLTAFLLAQNPALADGPKPPVNTFQALWPALTACWRPPAETVGSEITLRFGLDHTGRLRGLPIVTYSKLVGPAELREVFAKSALRALADCTPVNLTDSFGRIVANQVLTIRFAQSPKGQGLI
jgi:hypothetical protein